MQPKPPVKDCIEQYKSYVDQFVDQVLPAMPAGSPLSFDHYPAFDVPGDGSYDNYSAAGGYRANLAVIRAASLRANTSFWNCKYATNR